MATPRLGLVVEDKPTELSCNNNIKNYLRIRKDQLVDYTRPGKSMECSNIN